MSDSEPRREAAGTGVAAVGVAAFGIACCAVGPLALAALSGVAFSALIGVGAGVGALVALTWVAVVRIRRGRS